MKKAKAGVSEIERRLKSVSESHQEERKKLVSVHASLSQSLSQEAAMQGSTSLRAQLVSLSARQKQLLQCFTKQKELSSKLGELVERETKARKTGKSSWQLG